MIQCSTTPPTLISPASPNNSHVETPLTSKLQRARFDIFGGLIAAVVMLPYALSLGIISGLGPTAGIYGAIAVGVCSAVIGGTSGMISGASSPMAVATAALLIVHDGSIPKIVTTVIMAGLIQMVLGSLRVGYLLAYTPYSVITGLVASYGIYILIAQVLPIAGAPLGFGSLIGIVSSWPQELSNINPSAIGVAAVTLMVSYLWPRRACAYVPALVVALFAGTLAGRLWLTSAPVLSDLAVGAFEFQWPDLFGAELVSLMPGAITLAMLGSIDTLLCCQICDALTHEDCNPNRELVGQGLGNVAAGIIGGVPGSPTTASLLANIRTGGRSRVAGLTCAATLLGVILFLQGLVEFIPQAVLAGILVNIGLGIVDWRFMYRAARSQREHFIVLAATLGLALFFDIVTAVLVGLVAAALVHARQFERLELDQIISVPLLDSAFIGTNLSGEALHDYSARSGLVAFRGSLTVASSHKISRIIGKDIVEHDVVILDFTDTTHIDDSATMVIERLLESASQSRHPVHRRGPHGSAPQQRVVAWSTATHF